MCYGSAALVEAAARAGPDAIVIDRQHGLWERRELEAAIATHRDWISGETLAVDWQSGDAESGNGDGLAPAPIDDLGFAFAILAV